MAKIIIQADGEIDREILLTKARLTIGRRAHNDVVIDHAAISSQHAVIVVTANDVYLEDLGSTNGTKVNGQPVRKHYLQHQDVIALAGYTIHYCTDDSREAGNGNAQIVPDPLLSAGSEDHDCLITLAAPTINQASALLRVLNGTSAGKMLALTKSIMTIGRPGLQLAAVTSGPDGFSLLHIEGDTSPLVNGQSIGNQFYNLQPGDVLNLSGTQLEFCLVA